MYGKNAHANHVVAWKPAELTDLPLNMRVITDLHELVKALMASQLSLEKGSLFSLYDDCMSVPVFSLKVFVPDCTMLWHLVS